MGKHSTPNSIKVMHGERNKDRFNLEGVDVEKLKSIPDCPQWFDVKTKLIYEYKAEYLLNLKLLTALDVDYLLMLCLLQSKMFKLWEAGETPSMSMYTQFDKFSSKLGFTVIDRQKMPTQKDEGLSKREERKLKMMKNK